MKEKWLSVILKRFFGELDADFGPFIGLFSAFIMSNLD
jgi:hypothetical protein